MLSSPLCVRLEEYIYSVNPHPARSRFQCVNNIADHSSIINARLAACICGQVERILRKPLVCQPEQVPIQSCILLKSLNRNRLITLNILQGCTLY
jgi:hypothetical protein